MILKFVFDKANAISPFGAIAAFKDCIEKTGKLIFLNLIGGIVESF